MKITKNALLRLGFEQEDIRCFKRIESSSIHLPDLQLDWDPVTGLWLTEPDDPMESIFRDLTHVDTIEKLQVLYQLLSGEQLCFEGEIEKELAHPAPSEESAPRNTETL